MAEVQVAAGPGEKDREEESVSWTPEVEVCLFHAMLGHKPVGVNRHFHMICIRDKFSQNIGRQISSKIVWEHLNVMYDMQALHESEILPFPNGERNFVLPEDIIHEGDRNCMQFERLSIVASSASNSASIPAAACKECVHSSRDCAGFLPRSKDIQISRVIGHVV
ncbi:MRG/MORF4L-binding protein isoform X2 [Hypanus sabinus]|uniref:MRG/MORF4L-binding protein isoform X2 n=1 Tax=Hypanus sabinus TaxID=79690 RepID=UPI0028C45941|nr:MRG/MORF4L-binding protein isoform X2 [Hypanus sabinus]